MNFQHHRLIYNNAMRYTRSYVYGYPLVYTYIGTTLYRNVISFKS